MNARAAVAAAVAVSVALGCAIAAAEEAGKGGLRRSDVVFMGASAPQVYKDYGTTVVSWGDRPWTQEPNVVADFARRLKAARDLGIVYLPGAAFRTAFAGMIDYDPNFMDSVCRNLDGAPITVPWLWDQKHKGFPAYWFCTNSPAYRAYLKYQLEAAVKLDVQGIHIDDYSGTAGTAWVGGCFCHWCMADFREYLKKHADPAELKKLGIASLDGFDYGKFLHERGVTNDAFKNKATWYPEQVPLSWMFLQFEAQAATQWVAEYRQWAEGVAGHPLMLCVNSGVSGPDDLMIAPTVTFFSGEVGHGADKGKVSAEPIWSFKLGDALSRPVACTAAGGDWAFVNANNKPGLVRTWIAQAYAFGHQFMPPVHQWCYTQEKGTHWWSPDPKEFDYLTQFVRANARLFDGYDSVAHVGLLYSNAAFRHYKRGATDACSEMALRNVPFRIVMAGDEWLPGRLKPDDLKGLDALVYVEPADLDPAQQKVLDESKIAVKWADAKDRLTRLAPQYISVMGAQNVTVVPRARGDDASAPFVCQLVNRNYDLKSDAMEVQRDFTIRLADSLFGAGVRAAKLYAPNAEPVELKVDREGQAGVIHVPSLDIWGVLELTPLGR